MRYELLHLYGPFSIHSYGIAIAIGLVIASLMVKRDPRFKQLHLQDNFISMLSVAIFAGLLGGRLLYLAGSSEPFSFWNIVSFWEPGFSVLGALMTIIPILWFYLYLEQLPILAVLDLLALYAPLLQSISRIGCFFAGCCFGVSCLKPWAVTYDDPLCMAPLGVPLHPTQLYSSLFLFFIFICMYFWIQKRTYRTGQLLCWYVFLTSAERFVIDFWRDDRIFVSLSTTLSFLQLVACGLMIISLISFVILNYNAQKSYEHI